MFSHSSVGCRKTWPAGGLQARGGRWQGKRVASGVVQYFLHPRIQYFLHPRIPSSRRQVILLASAMTSQEWHVEKPPCVNGTEPLAISLSWLSRFLGCSDKHKISQATVSHRICFKGHETETKLKPQSSRDPTLYSWTGSFVPARASFSVSLCLCQPPPVSLFSKVSVVQVWRETKAGWLFQGCHSCREESC